MSPRMTWVRADRPPVPSPWTARAAMSMPMFCDSPATTEAATNRPRAIWKRRLRPKMSDSLPQSGVETVIVRRVALATHESCSWPPRSPTIVGRAVPTTDVESIEVISARRSPREDLQDLAVGVGPLWCVQESQSRRPPV